MRQGNKGVVESFIRGVESESFTGSLYSTGNRLMSYSTCIAEWTKNGNLRINMTKYSVTTSKHQSYLLCCAKKIYDAETKLKFMYEVTIGTQYLSYIKDYYNSWQL
jgi:hypothetical protein